MLPKREKNGRFPKGVAQITTHGKTATLTYKIWTGVLSRCRNKGASGYENYGGRGIGFCERWLSFENFLSDMGECPAGMSIDRIDGNGDYTKDNCRWSSRLEQNRNRRSNFTLTYLGKTLCSTVWSEAVGISSEAIRARTKRGWSAEKTLTTPIRAHKEYEYANK